ncbi:ABC transporter substrate-binding protein [Cupriavidus sp. UYMMa02A]|nr:ABC transporter substrate-binding protein [Cupriavidus sp. UYMMa02A]
MLASAMALAAGTAMAETGPFPQKPVRIVLPFAPGGSSDVMARLIAEQLSKIWQQPVIVENRTGASGIVAAEAVAKAPPDGLTALLTVTALVQAPALYKKVSFDPLKDFSPVSQVATMPLAFALNPSIPAKSLAEFIALARARPGHYSYGSFGTGSAGHLYMELLKDAAKIDILHVPYKGERPALTDLLGGQLSAIILSVPGAKPYAADGKLIPIAVTGSTRAQQLPNTPTFAEAGYRDIGLESIGWYGLLLPARTPKEITQKFSRDLNAVLRMPEINRRMTEYGITLTGTTPEAFDKIMREDFARWNKVIREKNIQPD